MTVQLSGPGQLPPGCIRGRDGKLYPDRKLPEQTRRVLVGEVHRQRHGGATFREIVTSASAAGFKVSLGTVHAWLATWRCDACSGVANAPHELQSPQVNETSRDAPEQPGGGT